MKKFSSLHFVFSLFIVLFFCCKKPEYAGPGVQPSRDLLHGKFDGSQRIAAITTIQDSVATDETTLNLAGCINDPYFGVGVCAFYSQLHLTGVNVDFGIAPVLDSIVLSLAYAGYYGDTTTLQTIHVKEVTEDMNKDSIYYSNKRFGTNGTNLGFCSKAPRPTDSVNVGGTMTAPHLRVRLDVPFGNRILAAAASGYLADNSTFSSYFKGLYILPDSSLASGKGAIVYYDLLNPASKMTVYYNHGSFYDFVFDDKCARVNNFTHHYQGTEIQKQLDHTNTDTNLVYVQGTAGTCTKIIFPDIKHLRDSGHVIINKAELVMYVGANSVNTFGPPVKILLAGVDSLNGNQILPDQLIGASYFGGYYEPSNAQYTFNLSKYIQKVIDDSLHADFGLRIVPSGSAVSAARLVLGGGKSNDRAMKLNIVYTRY